MRDTKLRDTFVNLFDDISDTILVRFFLSVLPLLVNVIAPPAILASSSCVKDAIFDLNSLERSSPSALPSSRAWIVLTEKELEKYGAFYAISDVHGNLHKVRTLFEKAGVISSTGKWKAGNSLIVIAGDHINKGSESYQTIIYFRTLQKQAEAAGGRVILLKGNHEAKLLADPSNASKELQESIRASGKQLKRTLDENSSFMRYLDDLPSVAFVGDSIVAHSGYVTEKTLKRAFQAAREGDPSILLKKKSLIETKDWQKSEAKVEKVRETAKKLGAKTIIMGHQSEAFGFKGIGATGDGFLVKIDTGMVDGGGGLLYCPSALRFSRAGVKACKAIDETGKIKAVSGLKPSP